MSDAHTSTSSKIANQNGAAGTNVVKNPVTEEVLSLIACLRKRGKEYGGWNCDFIRYAFVPFVAGKLTRWDGDIKVAVNLWCTDPDAAEKEYGHISKWDVSRITNMYELFQDRLIFNEDISAWDVSKVTNMQRMFFHAKAFNQDLGKWDVSKVKDMICMFSDAKTFDSDIGAWNVSSVTSMADMFYGAKNFNQDLSSWHINVTDAGTMFDDCPLPSNHKPSAQLLARSVA